MYHYVHIRTALHFEIFIDGYIFNSLFGKCHQYNFSVRLFRCGLKLSFLNLSGWLNHGVLSMHWPHRHTWEPLKDVWFHLVRKTIIKITNKRSQHTALWNSACNILVFRWFSIYKHLLGPTVEKWFDPINNLSFDSILFWFVYQPLM